MSARHVIHVDIYVIGSFILGDPGGSGVVSSDFVGKPPTGQIDLVDSTVDHRASFEHSPPPSRAFDPCTGLGRFVLAVQVPDVDQAKRANVTD
jgi:hypothetical protein